MTNHFGKNYPLPLDSKNTKTRKISSKLHVVPILSSSIKSQFYNMHFWKIFNGYIAILKRKINSQINNMLYNFLREKVSSCRRNPTISRGRPRQTEKLIRALERKLNGPQACEALNEIYSNDVWLMTAASFYFTSVPCMLLQNQSSVVFRMLTGGMLYKTDVSQLVVTAVIVSFNQSSTNISCQYLVLCVADTFYHTI